MSNNSVEVKTNRDVTVAVGMSGGVDSSLAAHLLKKAGYRVLGLTMKIYGGDAPDAENNGHACYGPGEKDDIRLAESVSEDLEIPHHTLDLKSEYRQSVLDYFTAEYTRGRTPNPCTRCNPIMKFGFLLSSARAAGIHFDRFATGHYARIGYSKDFQRHVLMKAADSDKDQSYFLYGLAARQLPNLMFPLGGLTKPQVRAQAQSIRLPVSARPESQDFIEGGDYSCLFGSEFKKPGPILGVDGARLGTHRGIIHYTIGQRRGLGIAHSDPLYVLSIDPERNALVAGPRSRLLARGLIAENLNLLCVDCLEKPLRIKAKIRQKHRAAEAALTPLAGGRARVVFDTPQLSITPGQAVVFYDNDIVLGGGIICERLEDEQDYQNGFE